LSGEDEWTGIDGARFRLRNGRTPLPGEYGCYRSHIAALEAFVASGMPYAVIAEDDIRPDGAGMERVRAIVEAVPGLGVVRLVNHRAPFFIEHCATRAGDHLGRTIHGPQGSAAAYLVSRGAARGLIEAIAVMEEPFDAAMERFWQHGVDVLSVRRNVFPFSDLRAASTIEATRRPGDGRFAAPARIAAHLDTGREILRRFHAVLSPRAAWPEPAIAPREHPHSAAMQFVMALLLLASVSPVWWEKDIYRYATALAVLPALVVYFRTALWTASRPLIGWAGFACLGWALYVALSIARSGQGAGQLSGSAEGVYLLPALYPTFGYAMVLWVRRPFAIATAFMIVSASVLVVTTPFAALLDPGHVPATALHSNTIHAAVAAGFLAICATCFLLAVLRGVRDRRGPLAALGLAVFALALANVYLLGSKGVWLALGIVLPVLLGAALARAGSARSAFAVLALVAVTGLATVAGSERIRAVGGATASAASELVAAVASGEGLVSTMDRMIGDGSVPESSRQRLMLWSSAVTIWGQAPVTGLGPQWRDAWVERRHQEMDTTLLHNGYLEIGIRYGLVGLAFYALLAAWALRTVWRAWRAGLIDRAALECFMATGAYFALTLLTNSNNRLALGEAFMLVAFGFAFYCSHRMQKAGLHRPSTYF
jgi:O-antigen ligase